MKASACPAAGHEHAHLDPAKYDGSGVCPRCGSGWPNCVDGHKHAETCAIYNWSDGYLCGRCSLELALEITREKEAT